jgi:hypothetical protein
MRLPQLLARSTSNELTTQEYGRIYQAAPSTVQQWKTLNAPLDDPAAIMQFRRELRSGRGVSKISHRIRHNPTPQAPTLHPAEGAITSLHFKLAVLRWRNKNNAELWADLTPLLDITAAFVVE